MKSTPNLLFIFADEMREMAMSCSGNHNLHTPNLDKMASQGVRFSRMYTTFPLCSPARASMLSGCFPHNAGIMNNAQFIKPEIPCIAEITSEAGYATGHIGKWHVGGKMEGESDWYAPVERLKQRGFEYWAGFEHGHSYWNSVYFREDGSRHTFAEGTYEPDGQTDLAINFIEKNKDKAWHMERPIFHFTPSLRT